MGSRLQAISGMINECHFLPHKVERGSPECWISTSGDMHMALYKACHDHGFRRVELGRCNFRETKKGTVPTFSGASTARPAKRRRHAAKGDIMMSLGAESSTLEIIETNV